MYIQMCRSPPLKTIVPDKTLLQAANCVRLQTLSEYGVTYMAYFSMVSIPHNIMITL